jgi:hypothetical protein
VPKSIHPAFSLQPYRLLESTVPEIVEAIDMAGIRQMRIVKKYGMILF